MSRRKILIGVSIAGHAALFAGVAIHSIWDLEQLEHDFKSRTALAVMTPPAPPAGGSYESRPVEVKRKAPQKVVVKDLRQPPRKLKDELRITMDNGGSEPGTGPGKGPGIGPGGGIEISDPCLAGGLCGTVGTIALPEVPRPEPVKVHDVRPEILKGLRVQGETAIRPPRDVYDEMVRTRTYETTASIKLCVTAEGTVSSVKLTTSTGYADYDRALVAAAGTWIYRPYTVNGTPVPACGMVTFQYAMK